MPNPYDAIEAQIKLAPITDSATAEQNPYDAIEQTIKTSREQAVRGSILSGAAVDPERAARVQQVGKQLGLPPEIVDPNLDAMEGRARFQAVPFAHLIEQNPRLARWLSDRNNAAIGHDDIPALLQLDSAARLLEVPKEQPDNTAPTDPLPWGTGVFGRYARKGAFFGTQVATAPFAAAEWAVRRATGESVSDAALAGDYSMGTFSPLASLYRRNDQLRAEERAAQTYHEGLAQKSVGMLVEMASNPINTVAPVAGAEAAVVSLATKANQAMAGKAALSGASLVMGEQTALQTLADGMQRQQMERKPGESGFILPTGRELANAGAQGFIAYLGGQASGLRGILRGFNPVKMTGRELASDVAIQSSVMAAQGAAGAVAGGVIEGRMPSMGDLGETAVVSGFGGGAMSLGFGSFHFGAQEMHARIVDSANAAAAADIMAKLGVPLVDSKAFKRNGERVMSMIKDAIGQGDGVTYHQADDLAEIAGAAGIAPQVLLDRLGITAEDLAVSRATNAPLPIDAAKILGEAAKGGAKAMETLLDTFHASPSAPSLKQAAAFAKTLPDEIAKLKADAEKATAGPREPTPTELVYDDVYHQLLSTGHDATFSANNAALWAAHYGATSFWFNREHGPGTMDPHAEYMRKPLRLVRSLPEGMANTKSAFGKELEAQRQERAKKWSEQDAKAAALDKERNGSADEAAAKLAAEAAGKPGQDIVDQALAILADESKKTGRVMRMGDVTAALGTDFGLRADPAIHLTAEQTARGELLAKALRARGHTLNSLGIEGARKAGVEMRRAEIAAVPKLAADSPEVTKGIADAIALKDAVAALNDPRVEAAMPDDVRADKEAEAAALAKSLAPILDKLPISDELRAEVEAAVRDAGGTLNQAAKRDGPVRGSFEPASNTIRLFRAENRSTFAHETGHAFLTHMEELAARPDAPATIREDFAKIRAHVGAEGEHTGFTRAQHELWARSWEAYLMEGKAPSPTLSGTFARFRTWLTAIYRSAAGLAKRSGHPIEMTPEIRGVMDRMLASEDEVAAAQAQQAQAAIFGDAKIADEAKMSPEERAAYSAAVSRAQQSAEARVLNALIAEEAARRKAEGSVAYRAIRDEVATEVDADPIYVAIRALRERVTGPGGESIPGLDREAAARAYEDSALPADREIARRLGNLGVLADKGKAGVHPDVIAPLFGFDSGDAMMRALVSARSRDSVIAGESKARFQERHPDLQPTAGDIAEKAMQAVHGSARADVLRLEVQKLGQRIGKQPAPADVLRKIAKDRVGRTKVADLRPDLYRAAEAKAARHAFEAATKGDWSRAFEEKQREWLNYELTRACQDAKDSAVSMRDRMLSLTTPAAQERIGKAGGWEWAVIAPDGAVIARPDSQAEAEAILAQRPDAKLEQTSGFQEQINAILERFDLKPISAAQAQRRRSLNDWAAMMADQGFQIDLPKSVTDDLRPSWKSQTVDELAEVHDAVVQIEHLAMQKNRLLAIHDKVTFAHARDALVEAITTNARETREGKSGKDLLDGVRNGLDGMIGSLERLGDIVLRLDGDKAGGIVCDTLKRPFDQAANVEAARAAKTTAELHDALETWEAAGGRGRGLDAFSKKHIPEIGESLTHLERILVALNWGNEGNRERLLMGSGWDEAQAQAVLRTLDKADAELVKSLAKIINANWPDIAAKQRRVFGVVPEKVEGASFEIAGETIEGFYFPIVADPTKSSAAERRSLRQIAEDMRRGAYTAATTQRNHTKDRVGPSGERLDLSLSVISRHLNKVFHDLTHHETLIDANRLLRDKFVVAAIEAHYGPKMVATINDAMVRIAGATIREVDGMERVVQIATRNVGRAAMGYQVWTAIQGIVGITQSMERVGPLRFLQAMSPVVGNAGAMQSLGSYIHGMSDYMARKYKQSGENMAEETATGAGVIGRDLPDALRPYALMEGVQRIVDYPTWKAAFDHAVELGNDAKPNGNAVLMADQAVIDAQSGKDIKDKAAVLEGSQYKKLMTMFYGYFNSTFNLTRRAVKRTDFTSPKDIAILARSFALLYAIPTAATVAGMALLRPDKKRDGRALPGRLSAETLAMMMATVPVVRELSAGAKGLFGDGSPYSGPASMRGLETLNMMLSQVGGAMHGKGDHIGKASLQTLGLATGLPTVQAQRTLDGILYDIDKKTANPVPLLFGKPR